MRRFETATLVDSYIDEYGALLHQFQHVFGNELRGSIARNKYRADDNIDGAQLLTDVVF